MAIVRSASKASKGSTHASSSTEHDPPVRHGQRSGEKTVSVPDSEASGDSELAQKGVEICQVGEDICAVPYELFELPDLKGILTLDTWNFCLTEEEREKLCAYLPNLDEESYRKTLRELFAGEVFSFSSPMTELFDRLKGGLCHPQVVRYREGLKYVQRKGHYHRLRNYHNNMVNDFLEMRNFWQRDSHADFEERIGLWKSWKSDRSKPLPGPSENKGRFLGKSTRKAKLLKQKEPLESPHHLPDRVAASRTHLKKKAMKPKVGSKPKGCVEVSLEKLNGNETESNRETRKLVKNLVISEVGQSEGGSILEENNTTDHLVGAFALGNDNLATEKPKKEFGKKGAVLGPGRKRKAVTEVGAMEEEKRNEEMMANPKRSPLTEQIMDEENVLRGTECDKRMNFLVEQKQEYQELAEPKKKLRKTRAKEKISNGYGQGVTSVELEHDEGQALTDAIAGRDGIASDEVAEDSNLNVKEKDSDSVADADPASKKQGRKRSKKKLEWEDNGLLASTSSLDGSSAMEKAVLTKASKRQPSLTIPSIVLSFPFSIIHLLSAVRMAMILPSDEQDFDATSLGGESAGRDTLNDSGTLMMPPEVHYFEPNGHGLLCNGMDIKNPEEQKKGGSLSIPFLEIVRRVKENPGDLRILDMQEPLQGLVRGVLKVLSSKTPPGIKGWKPFAFYDKENRSWSWIGPLPSPPLIHGMKEVQISAEAWGVSQKIVIKIQELFANWLKQAQETLQQRGQLVLPPLPPTAASVDEKERFRELRAQKSLITINPTSEEMKAYFHREEALRFSFPDRAFTYTKADGQKSAVAPLRRMGGKPNSKVRDHFMLKPDRPPHVTILCLVRDATARLPGSIGTRADICALIRDSQYIVEDVSDAQLNQVVSGALDRLHYERDPCVRFDGDRKLWVYLHTDRDEEDFEDDGTSSTKRWKKSKKEGVENENTGFLLSQDYGYSGGDDQDPCGLGLDFSSQSCFVVPGELSVYSSSRPELIYNHQTGPLVSPHILGSGFPEQAREDSMLAFIDLPPSIQSPCVSMQQSHPMGWEVLRNGWDQEPGFHRHDHVIQEDYNTVAAPMATHREVVTMMENGLH